MKKEKKTSKNSHYFDLNPDLEHDIKTISYTLQDEAFTFQTDNGVFSKDKVDHGTHVMLKAVIEDLSDIDLIPTRGLDFGCGYGVVSIVLGKLFPSQNWMGVDVNERAVSLACKNAKTNRVDGVSYIVADGIESLEYAFDLILLNPPIRTGKAVYYKLFEQAAKHLSENGFFYIVIQKKQGADSAFKFLTSIFTEVETIDKTSGYHTIRCSNPL